MSDRIYAATRKGLFTLDRSGNGAWGISRSRFLGDPVTMLLDDARDGTLYAALNLGHFGVKMHRSKDRGETWRRSSTGPITRRRTRSTRPCGTGFRDSR